MIIEAHLCSNNRPDLHRRTHANAGTPRGTSRRTRTTPGFGWLSDGSGRWARPRNRVGARTDSANGASRARFRDAARLRAPQARQWSAVSGPAAGRRDCARNGPHEELPAQGIARARVVLSVRLARCQREAARAFYGVACPRSGAGSLLKDHQRLLLAARVDVADGGAMIQLACPDPARNRSGRDHVRSGPASASAEPMAGRSRGASAGWPAGPWLGGRRSLAGACCPGRWAGWWPARFSRPLIARCGRR